MQANLVFNYIKGKKKGNKLVLAKSDDINLPYVTVQLPLFNEKYVVERLLDAVANFDYPSEKLEIQVLDDSTDESVKITTDKVAAIVKLGVDIKHIHRTNRQGFKAGALAEGLKVAKGELIAIFDADFIPKKDFLLKTVAHFADESIGLVQTKWEHLNKNYSMLTKIQAFGLDAHFTVEQSGRNVAGHFMNFNGTAGIWRKSCIDDAGGWSSDTLTEDLDLSYRAQLKGWKFKYLQEVGSPAELPAAMNALKTQQFRWTKGAAECTRKNLIKVFRAENIGMSTKVHALFHLMNSFLFICIILTSILSVPAIVFKNNYLEFESLFKFGSFFLFSLIILGMFFWVSSLPEYTNKLKASAAFLIKFPLFLSVSMGLSLHNAIAVLEGYIGKKTPFVRTPKFNIIKENDTWKTNKYLTSSINMLTMLEGLLAIYFAAGIGLAIHFVDYGFLPFHIMLTFGFGFVFYYSINHSQTIKSKQL